MLGRWQVEGISWGVLTVDSCRRGMELARCSPVGVLTGPEGDATRLGVLLVHLLGSFSLSWLGYFARSACIIKIRWSIIIYWVMIILVPC